MPHSMPLPKLSPRVQRCCAACSGRRVQSRVSIFKDGHPYLVRLPSPMSNRLCNGEPTVFTPSCSLRRALASPKRLEHRTFDAPSRSSGSLCQVPPTSRLEPSRPQCGETERRPDSSAPSTDVPRVDGLRQSSRSTRPTHQNTGFCNPHDPRTRSALFAPTDGVTFRPRFSPVRVRNSNFRCCVR